jgi:hypothetical protein
VLLVRPIVPYLTVNTDPTSIRMYGDVWIAANEVISLD